MLVVIASLGTIFAQKSTEISHTKYEGLGDLKFSLNFTNKHKCVIRQEFMVNLPSGKLEKCDEFRYVVCGDTIHFFALDEKTPVISSWTKIPDYFVMCHTTNDWVEYQGKPIFESSISGDTSLATRKLRAIDGYMCQLPSYFTAAIMDVDSNTYPIDGPGSIIYCDFFIVCSQGTHLSNGWYGRVRPTYKINKKKDLIGRCFANLSDSLCFLDCKTCRIVSRGHSELAPYQVDGSYITFYRNKSSKVDCMLFCDGFLYDSRITQYRESAPYHMWIDNEWQEPTGELRTRVYVDTQKTEINLDLISSYFKHYLTPKNVEITYK